MIEAPTSTRLAGQRVLVTGGSGFIGRHVVQGLRELGADVVVADLLAHPDPAVESVVGDLTEPGAVGRALMPGTTSVVHLAAVTSVLRSVDHPAKTFATNVAMTAELLEQARSVGVGSFIFASTNAVVGEVGDEPLSERSVLHPLTPYGATKAAAEMLLGCYQSSYGIRTASLRFANVYGPGMSAKDSIVARLMRAASGGTGMQVYGDGAQVRDYVFVADVAAALLLCLESPVSGPLVIGSGVSTSVLDIIEMTRQVTGAPVPVEHVPGKAGEMPAVVLDTAKARSHGWKPTVGLADGLQQVWSWWGRLPEELRRAAPDQAGGQAR